MLAPSDIRIVMLRRLWLREISSMLEGGPLTEWKVSAEPFIPAPD